jgi:glycosyltransferase involved in cell wall biosynthesis
MTNNPVISIITAVYNGEKYLEEAILSVLNQSYIDIEYIIIDGGSTDGTISIIKKYENSISYWVSEKDGGIYDAWNKGINKAQGSWIGFLGADDFYKSNAIEKYVELIIASKNVNYISSKVQLISQNKKSIKIIGECWNWSKFSKNMNTAHVGSLHSKELYEKYSLYDPDFKIAGDYEFLLRSGRGLNAGFVSEPLCYMRTGGVSGSGYEAFQEAYKAKFKNKDKYTFINLLYITLVMKSKLIIKKYILGFK